MLTHLDHLIVAVRQLESATKTYAALVGCAPSWEGTHAQWGTANSLFRLSNASLELLSPEGEGRLAAPLRERLDRHGEGLLGLAFGTDDARACAEWFRERGLPAGALLEGEGRERRSGATRKWTSVFLPSEVTRGPLVFAIERRSPPGSLPSGPPGAPQSSRPDAFDHVVIQSADPDASAALYRNGLGLRLALERTSEDRKLRMLFFRVGRLTLEVVSRLGAAPEPERADRLWGVAYRVPDVAAGRERLVAAGFDVSEVRPGFRPATRVCTVRAPTHGVATLLIGPEATRNRSELGPSSA